MGNKSQKVLSPPPAAQRRISHKNPSSSTPQSPRQLRAQIRSQARRQETGNKLPPIFEDQPLVLTTKQASGAARTVKKKKSPQPTLTVQPVLACSSFLDTPSSRLTQRTTPGLLYRYDTENGTEILIRFNDRIHHHHQQPISI